MTEDQLLSELSQTTGMSAQEWADFLACTTEQQALMVEGYRAQSWAQSASTLERVIAILQTAASIAVPIGAIAGAGGAVIALAKLL